MKIYGNIGNVDVKDVKYFCNGKEVKYEVDKSNPLKLVNPIDSILIKLPVYRSNNENNTE